MELATLVFKGRSLSQHERAEIISREVNIRDQRKVISSPINLRDSRTYASLILGYWHLPLSPVSYFEASTSRKSEVKSRGSIMDAALEEKATMGLQGRSKNKFLCIIVELQERRYREKRLCDFSHTWEISTVLISQGFLTSRA